MTDSDDPAGRGSDGSDPDRRDSAGSDPDRRRLADSDSADSDSAGSDSAGSDPADRDPVSPPVALTIAGSDSGGGAGQQADLKAMTAHGVFGASVVTATTAQHTRGVEDVHPIPPDHVAAQYDAVVGDLDVDAVKTGMLATAPIVETATRKLAGFDGPVVVDPVLVAASGDRLLDPDAEDAYRDLIAAATLVTPNADEAAVLTDRPVESPDDAVAAARDLVAAGADAALVTGGHLDTDAVVDVLAVAGESAVVDGESVDGETAADRGSADRRSADPAVTRLEHPRVETDATHGSGCTLSSAIAARLARGEPLRDAVAAAVEGMDDALARGYDVGQGPGAVNPTATGRPRREPPAPRRPGEGGGVAVGGTADDPDGKE